jgi:hypothetical protein
VEGCGLVRTVMVLIILAVAPHPIQDRTYAEGTFSLRQHGTFLLL